MSNMEFVQKSKKDLWQTPDELWKPISMRMRINLDPCPGEKTEIGDINFRLKYGYDGLSLGWFGTVFVNPPFSEKGKWLDKAIEEIQSDGVDCIFLVTPDSTDVKSWWHGKIAEHCDYTYFPKGRINYVDPESGEQKNGVSFGTAVSILGEPNNSVLNWMDENGDLVKRNFRKE